MTFSETHDAGSQHLAAKKELSDGHEEEIRALHRLNPQARLAQFAMFLVLYAGGTVVAATTTASWWQLFAVLLMGFAFNLLGLFIHEGLHGLLAEGKRNNYLITLATGIPILMSPSAYRLTHAFHHVELGKDRDFGTYKQHTRRPFVVWLCYYAQLLAGSLIYMLVIPFLSVRMAPPAVRRVIIREFLILWSVAGTVIWLLPAQSLLLYWFWPLVVMNFMTNLRGLASHCLCDPSDPLLASRVLRSNRLMHLLLLNEHLHLHHHLFPNIPSYNLPKLDALIRHKISRATFAESYSQFLYSFVRATLARDLRPLAAMPLAAGPQGLR